MVLERAEIIRAIEASDSLMPEIPGMLTYLPFQDIVACEMDTPQPMANRVSQSSLSDQAAPATIRNVISHYRSHGKGLIWNVGPGSTPANLGSLLIDSGMRLLLTSVGMSIPLPAAVSAGPQGVRITETPVSNFEPAITPFSVGFGIPMSDSRIFHEMLHRASHQVRSRIYLAYVDGDSEPAAVAYLTYFPDSPVVLLGGAATRPEARGKGAYTSLLTRRLTDAHADGISAAIVLANAETSAPICRKHGFESLCEVQVYICDPPA